MGTHDPEVEEWDSLDLWLVIQRRLAELEMQGIIPTVTWVRGHDDAADERGGSEEDRHGNMQADVLADKGAKSHHPVEKLRSALKRRCTIIMGLQAQYVEIIMQQRKLNENTWNADDDDDLQGNGDPMSTAGSTQCSAERMEIIQGALTGKRRSIEQYLASIEPNERSMRGKQKAPEHYTRWYELV